MVSQNRPSTVLGALRLQVRVLETAVRPIHAHRVVDDLGVVQDHERQLEEIRAEHQRERELFAGLVDRDHRDSRRADDADGTSEFRFALAILMAFDSADAQNFAPANARVALARLRDTQ